MPTRRFALAAVMALAAAPAFAQAKRTPPPMFSDADAAAVRTLIDRYFTAFSVKDYATFAQVFTAPYLMAGREGLATIPTVEGVVERYKAIRVPLENADYSASQVVEMRLTPLSGRMAMANVHWRRLKKDGSLLNEGAEVLLTAKAGGQWKMTGVIPEDLRQFKAGG